VSNLIELQAQIEKLQKQASDLRAKDFQRTVREIREKMQAFGITLRDLQPAKGSKAPVVKDAPKKRTTTAAKKASGSTVAPKYRGPDGQTWSGRGLTPRWMTSLIEQGHSKEEFLILPL
jgi:DNA-binding protein H-NS